jgi:hypothetical protein
MLRQTIYMVWRFCHIVLNRNGIFYNRKVVSGEYKYTFSDRNGISGKCKYIAATLKHCILHNK